VRRTWDAGLDLWTYDPVDADHDVDAGTIIRELTAAGPVPVTVRVNSSDRDAVAGLALYEALLRPAHRSRLALG
jgi:hypothetical protein